MSRPPYEPTQELREKVSVAAGGGMKKEKIAIALGISLPTLEKYYDAELSCGAYQRRMEVLSAMHGAALKGNVSAQRAYMQLEPELSVPPEEKSAPKLGKKDAANAEAHTAAAHDPQWRELLPGQAGVKTLQ
jgi:hypothetical protein